MCRNFLSQYFPIKSWHNELIYVDYRAKDFVCILSLNCLYSGLFGFILILDSFKILEYRNFHNKRDRLFKTVPFSECALKSKIQQCQSARTSSVTSLNILILDYVIGLLNIKTIVQSIISLSYWAFRHRQQLFYLQL